MARDEGKFDPREDLSTQRPHGKAASAEPLDDEDSPLALDLEPEEESPFLRGQKRVPVRRSALPRRTATKVKYAVIALLIIGAVGFASAFTYNYGATSWRFRLDSSDNIEVQGITNVPRNAVLAVLGADIGRNLFFVPLAERKQQLEQIPWVESAAVMRLLPNRLRVSITERTPVAFARIGSRIQLIDAHGVLMDLPAGSRDRKYSFPVIVGMSSAEPLSTRAARMKIYSGFVRELDSEGSRYSADLSEVDLSDPSDIKVTVPDPAGAVLIHLGDANYLGRYKLYLAHVSEWRQQFTNLESVDLRYERQVIVNPDVRSGARKP
jgi:cell division protein FtsQ